MAEVKIKTMDRPSSTASIYPHLHRLRKGVGISLLKPQGGRQLISDKVGRKSKRIWKYTLFQNKEKADGLICVNHEQEKRRSMVSVLYSKGEREREREVAYRTDK